MATRDKSTALRQQFGRSVANLSFGMMQHSLQAAQKVGVDMLHTARSFDYYRKIFYHNQSRGRVLRQLQGKRIVDVGCGYTPYARDSMFRACHDAGLDFYGVDPRIEPEMAFTFRDRALARATGGSGCFSNRPPGVSRALAGTAQALPFDTSSIDEIVCGYLLYVWIEDEKTLAEIFEEFHRVLRPGGIARLFPLPDWQLVRAQGSRLRKIQSRFSIEQSFVPAGYRPRVMAAMLTEMTKAA